MCKDASSFPVSLPMIETNKSDSVTPATEWKKWNGALGRTMTALLVACLSFLVYMAQTAASPRDFVSERSVYVPGE